MSKTDTYRIDLLTILKDITFNFQVSHYYFEDSTNAKHIYNLERRPTTDLRLEHDYHGLGKRVNFAIVLHHMSSKINISFLILNLEIVDRRRVFEIDDIA